MGGFYGGAKVKERDCRGEYTYDAAEDSRVEENDISSRIEKDGTSQNS